MAYDIGPKIGLDGEKEFKTALAAINSEMKNLSAEMKASVTSMAGMASEEDLVAAKSDILSRSIEAGKQKVALIQGEYDRAKEKLNALGEALEKAKQEFGENSDEALKAEDAYNRQAKTVNDLGTKLNNAQADVNNMTAEMKKAEDGAEDMGDSLDKAGESGGKLSLKLKDLVAADLIASGIKKIGEAAKDLAGWLKDAMVDGAAYADDILTLSVTTGLSTDALQEYKYMVGLADVELETITGSMTKLTKNMNTARGGTGAAADAFQQLGISVTDATGQLRDRNDVFAEAIDALGKMTNETERDALSMSIFGKSAQDLNPLIAMGADGFKNLADEAHRMGYVLDEEALGKLGAAQDAFDRMNVAVESVKNQLAVALAPVIETVMSKIEVALQKIDWEKLGEAIGNVINFIIDHAKECGVALGVIAAGFMAIQIASSPITLVIAGITALVAGIALLWAKSEKFRDFVIGTVDEIKAVINGAVAAVQAAINFVISVFTALKDAWQATVDAIHAAIEWIQARFKALGDGIKAVKDAIVAAWTNLKDNVQAVKDAITGAFTTIATKASDVKQKIVTAFQGVIDFIIGLPAQALEIGTNLVEGLWNGINSKIEWIKTKIQGFCQSALEAIKNFFGIKSPSRVMRDKVGVMLARGMAEGIEKGTQEVRTSMRDLSDQVLKVADEMNNRILKKEEELSSAIAAEGLDDATKAALQRNLDLVKDFRTEYEKALTDLEKKQSDMAEKLKGYGDLFKTVQSETGSFLELTDLQADIDAIEDYGDALEALKGRGVYDTLMSEILGMNVDDATAYTKKLLAMTDEEYGEYMALWEQKQAAAADVARRFYADEMAALVTEYVASVPAELDIMKDDLYSVGKVAAKGLAQGILDMKSSVVDAALEVAAAARRALKSAEQIHSPSKKWAEIGGYMAEGVGVGFAEKMRTVGATITQSVGAVRSADLERVGSGVVNGLATSGMGGAVTVTVPLYLNGRQIAQAQIDDLLDVARQRGVSFA